MRRITMQTRPTTSEGLTSYLATPNQMSVAARYLLARVGRSLFCYFARICRIQLSPLRRHKERLMNRLNVG
jgi:hypothetical protein